MGKIIQIIAGRSVRSGKLGNSTRTWLYLSEKLRGKTGVGEVTKYKYTFNGFIEVRLHNFRANIASFPKIIFLFYYFDTSDRDFHCAYVKFVD